MQHFEFLLRENSIRKLLCYFSYIKSVTIISRQGGKRQSVEAQDGTIPLEF
jgi:hypothetical protein